MTESLQLYLTHEHPCPYLPGRRARNLVADPHVTKGRQQSYEHLTLQGFRRSGDFIYRPYCTACAACIPIRVPTQAFRLRRYQQRIRRRNRDLEVIAREAQFDADHFALYQRYLAARHPGSPMARASAEDYLSFLSTAWSDTRFYEFRLEGAAVAVAVTDRLEHGLSSVYTFFDPGVAQSRSLGTYAILWQIEHARALRLPWVFLGYWVRGCREMDYKDDFRPYEILRDGQWVRCDPGAEETRHIGSTDDRPSCPWSNG